MQLLVPFFRLPVTVTTSVLVRRCQLQVPTIRDTGQNPGRPPYTVGEHCWVVARDERHWDKSSSQVPVAEDTDVTAVAPLANKATSPTLTRMALDGENERLG